MAALSDPNQKYPAPPFKPTIATLAGPRRENGASARSRREELIAAPAREAAGAAITLLAVIGRRLHFPGEARPRLRLSFERRGRIFLVRIGQGSHRVNLLKEIRCVQGVSVCPHQRSRKWIVPRAGQFERAFDRLAPRVARLRDSPKPVASRIQRSSTTPIAIPAATSLAQCASSTTRVATSKDNAAQTELRCDGGNAVAAEARAPACNAWPEGNASYFFGKRYAVQAAIDGQPVGTLLVDELLDEMRKDGGGDRGQQDVVASTAGRRVLIAAIDPPAQRHYRDHVFVCPPCEGASGPLNRPVGVVGNKGRRLSIQSGRAHCEHGHGRTSRRSHFGRWGRSRRAFRRTPDAHQ